MLNGALDLIAKQCRHTIMYHLCDSEPYGFPFSGPHLFNFQLSYWMIVFCFLLTVSIFVWLISPVLFVLSLCMSSFVKYVSFTLLSWVPLVSFSLFPQIQALSLASFTWCISVDLTFWVCLLVEAAALNFPRDYWKALPITHILQAPSPLSCQLSEISLQTLSTKEC